MTNPPAKTSSLTKLPKLPAVELPAEVAALCARLLRSARANGACVRSLPDRTGDSDAQRKAANSSSEIAPIASSCPLSKVAAPIPDPRTAGICRLELRRPQRRPSQRGCGVASCGACTVHVDGVKIDTLPVSLTPGEHVVQLVRTSDSGGTAAVKSHAWFAVPSLFDFDAMLQRTLPTPHTPEWDGDTDTRNFAQYSEADLHPLPSEDNTETEPGWDRGF